MSKKKMTIEELLEEALVPQEERPYKLSENWVWVNSGQILDFIGGGTPSKSNKDYWNGNIPWATVKDIKERCLSTTIDTITVEGLKNSSASMASPNELLLITRMSPGKNTITKISTTINQDLKIVRPKVDILPYFLWLFFTVNTPLIESMSTGTTVKGIQVEKLKKLPFPLPPLNEQNRIAKKVEGLLIKIEEAKQLIEETKETFELRRAAVLDKAFRGKLGTNDCNEESMINLVGEDKVISSTEHDVPVNWVWTSLKDCLDSIQYGYTETSSLEEIGPKFLRITDIQNDNVDWGTVPYCKITEKELEKYKLEDNDIVVARTGATTGKSYLINNPPTSVFASYLIRLRCKNSVFPRYLWEFMKSHIYWKQITVVKKGSAQPGANAQILGNLFIPVPPLNEQRRIAEKVENLLNKLEVEQKLAKTAIDNLETIKQSILSKAFRGELGTNDPSEESAIELLKEVLQEK